MRSIFQASQQHPYHLSVGAVLINEYGEVACHHFKKIGELQDVFTLMRETVENDETLVQAVERGLEEEFGATGEVKAYIGSKVTTFKMKSGVSVQKTTVYFVVKLKSIGTIPRKPGSAESKSHILWMKPEDMINVMDRSCDNKREDDLNEADILERILRLTF